MRILFLIFILSFLLCIPVFSQEAVKIDEFTNTTCDDYWSRTSFLYTDLNRNLEAKAYIFVYQGKLTKLVYDKKGNLKRTDYVSPPKNEANELIGYFERDAAFKDIPTDKVTFVEGGFREKFTVEFWIVPVGTNPPKPTPTLEKVKQRKPVRHPFGYCGEL